MFAAITAANAELERQRAEGQALVQVEGDVRTQPRPVGLTGEEAEWRTLRKPAVIPRCAFSAVAAALAAVGPYVTGASWGSSARRERCRNVRCPTRSMIWPIAGRWALADLRDEAVYVVRASARRARVLVRRAAQGGVGVAGSSELMGLSGALEGLREELQSAWEKGAGKAIRFRVSEVTLTLQAVAGGMLRQAGRSAGGSLRRAVVSKQGRKLPRRWC
jgi:hypothetical protein